MSADYIMTMPRFAGADASAGLWEGLVFLGTLAAFGALVLRQLDREGSHHAPSR